MFTHHYTLPVPPRPAHLSPHPKGVPVEVPPSAGSLLGGGTRSPPPPLLPDGVAVRSLGFFSFFPPFTAAREHLCVANTLLGCVPHQGVDANEDEPKASTASPAGRRLAPLILRLAVAG